MPASARMEGLKELDKALGELGKRAGRAVLRRVAKKTAAPVIAEAARLAPRDTGILAESVNAKATLVPRQRAMAKSERDEVNLYIGPQALPHAHLQEFGTVTNPPQPFMRPAWAAKQAGALADIKRLLAEEIERAAKRLAKRQAKAGGNV